MYFIFNPFNYVFLDYGYAFVHDFMKFSSYITANFLLSIMFDLPLQENSIICYNYCITYQLWYTSRLTSLDTWISL